MSRVDVLVVGGGPAGCATATVLARAGLSVRLVTTARSDRVWAGESLPPDAERLITSVFGHNVLLDPPHRHAYGVRGAWGSGELVDTEFMTHPRGAGWHVDRATFDAQLQTEATGAGAEVVLGAAISSVDATPEGWTVDAGSAIHECHWLVDASGRASAVVGRLGVPRRQLDQQIAEVAIVDSADDTAVTTIEAAPDGWWYSTPLPGAQRVVAYLTDVGLRTKAAGRPTFDERLGMTAHMASLVRARAPIVTRMFPADTSYREQLTGRGWSAVGDAAISWDPLSSQGIMTGVLMGGRLARAIVHQLQHGSGDALEMWDHDYRLILDEHIELRSYYASAERRWPRSPFWQRRIRT